MTTAAPKLPRERWLKMRATPKRFGVRQPTVSGETLIFSDNTAYSRARHPKTGKSQPWLRRVSQRPFVIRKRRGA